MDNSIYIRPLLISDAIKIIEWDNRPHHRICNGEKRHQSEDLETEKAWFKYRLEKTTDKCFAICMNFSSQHVGNIELTNITSSCARCEVFIGSTTVSEEAIVKEAIVRIKEYAFSYLKLNEIYADVHRDHLPLLSAFIQSGFDTNGLQSATFLRFYLHRINN